MILDNTVTGMGVWTHKDELLVLTSNHPKLLRLKAVVRDREKADILKRHKLRQSL
jgi:hypothetical protein